MMWSSTSWGALIIGGSSISGVGAMYGAVLVLSTSAAVEKLPGHVWIRVPGCEMRKVT